MGEANADTIGKVVFALGNRKGRIRANQSGEHRGVKSWQLPYLSTSERSPASVMTEAVSASTGWTRSTPHRCPSGCRLRLRNLCGPARTQLGT